MEQQARQFDTDPTKTVFYALAAYENNVTVEKIFRTQALATRFKTLAFDVDPKDRNQNVVYATQHDMASATISACEAIGIPEPVFVSSGYGLHCYYPVAGELTKDMWVKVSGLLLSALNAAGLVLDASKIMDPSMVLRPVGTVNKKNNATKPVRLLGTLRTYDLPDIVAKLKAFVKATPAAVAPKAAKKVRKSSVMSAILDTELPPGDGVLVEQRCAQLGAIAACGGDVYEPLWRLALGIAKHTTEPEVSAIRWSNGYAEYDHGETLAKMAAWGGRATTCAAFEKDNPQPCANCQHRGKVGSPIQLGIDNTVATPVTLPDGTKKNLPAGYVHKNGKLWRTVGEETTFVSDYMLYPSRRYKDEETGKSVCLCEVLLPKEGWHTLELPMDVLSKPSEFQMWLINHQIFVHSEASLNATRKYMLTYLQELQQELESDMMVGSYGWLDETHKEFILGTRRIGEIDNKEVRLTAAASGFAPAFVAKGDKDEWAERTKIFDAPNMQMYGLNFLASISSPLIAGSGLKSVVFNMYNKNSGVGKSTTGLFALSMFGNPEKLKLTVNDTDNSVFKTMGVFGNLPVYIDEITEVQPDRFKQICFFLTQGREKRRMNKTGGFQESVEWESLTSASSNKDMYTYAGDNDMSFDGLVMRILQFSVPDNALFSSEGSTVGYEMALFMQRNYGLFGEDFVRAIITMGGPHKIFSMAREKFARAFGFTFAGKERFWQAGFIAAYATGIIGRQIGAFRFDIEACIESGFPEVRRLRRELADDKMDSFDTVGQFCSEHASKIVNFVKNVAGRNDGAVTPPYPFEAVGRVERLCDDKNPFISGRLFVNQRTFRDWCHERGVDAKNLFGQLKVLGVVVYTDRRIALMRGTDKTLPAVRVFEIELTHPRFVDIMSQNNLGLPPVTLSLIGVKNAARTD